MTYLAMQAGPAAFLGVHFSEGSPLEVMIRGLLSSVELRVNSGRPGSAVSNISAVTGCSLDASIECVQLGC